MRSEPTPFPPVSVLAGGSARVELLSNVPFRIVRLVLPACPAGLLWSGWFVGKDNYMDANRPFAATVDALATGISLDRTIELEVEQAYLRRVYERFASSSAVSRLGEVIAEATEIRGVQVRISEVWGLSFYNPTPATIYYQGAAALIQRLV